MTLIINQSSLTYDDKDLKLPGFKHKGQKKKYEEYIKRHTHEDLITTKMQRLQATVPSKHVSPRQQNVLFAIAGTKATQ